MDRSRPYLTIPVLLGIGLLFLAPGLTGTRAQAAASDQSFFSAALTKTEDVSRADSAKSEDVVTILNLAAGFAMGSGVSLGLKYFDYSQDGKFLESERLVISGYGPMIGYMHASGIYGNFAYLIAPTKRYRGGDSTATYKGGSGYVIDVGKVWDLGSSFGLGIAVSQSKITYEEASGNATDTDLDGEWSDASLYPYVSLFLFF